MSRRSLWIVLGITLLLAFGLGWMRFTAPPQGNLAGSSLGGGFALTNQDGKPVTDKDFAGHYRLMYFGYTFCPDICPTDVGLIARGLKAFEARAPERGLSVAAPSLEELQHEAREALIEQAGPAHVSYRIRIRREARALCSR